MRVERLLTRLKREFVKVNILQASLDSILFFLAANFPLSLLDIQLTPSLSNPRFLAILTGMFFLGDLYYRMKNYRLEIYEEKNPELEEVLRTARDNLDQQNIVSQALFDDLLDRARTVTSESIIPSKKIIQKILVVGFLSFLTVLTGITGFQIQEDGGDLLPSFKSVSDAITGKDDDGFELKNSSEIFGDEQEIDPADMQIDFNITGSGESVPGEMEGASRRGELVLDNTLTGLEEDLELAKQYSLAIKEIGSNR